MSEIDGPTHPWGAMKEWLTSQQPLDRQDAALLHQNSWGLYVRDPEEEAWHASPEGLLAGAREKRAWAARLIAESEEMEARANSGVTP